MPPRPALTINLYLQDRPVLLVGSGEGADERASRLESAGATFTRMDEETWASWHKEPNSRQEYWLLLAHSDDDEVNAQAAQWARQKGMWAYAHDQPDYSDFSFPALAKRGALQIAIATHGRAPALAAQLRKQWQELMDQSAEILDPLMEELYRLRQSMPRGVKRMERLISLAKEVRIQGKLIRQSNRDSEGSFRQ